LSAFLPSFAGGAEKSILEEFKIYALNGFIIKAISFDILHNQDKYDFGVVSGENYKLKYKFLLSYSRLAFLFFNRKIVKKILESHLPQIKNSEFVILQGPYTPYIAKFCIKNRIPYHYYLRDGVSINLFSNQARGFRRMRKYLKLLLEMPFIIDFRLGNRGALKRAARIIANSDKMAELLFKRFGLKAAQVIYPKINISEITNFTLDPAKQKYITLIGGRDSDKAYEIFIRTAKKMPEYEFLLVEKRDNTYKIGNVTFAPRQNDVRKIYETTKVAVSISRWNNAFSGRVGMEAGRLGIPVISNSPVHNVDSRKVCVLKDIDNVDEWVEAIRSFEAKRGMFILNSDFGVRNTIGARARQIWKELPYKNGVNVFCRNYRERHVHSSLVKKVMPGGALLMKFINAAHIYLPLANKINLNKIKVDLFQFCLMKKLMKMKLKNISFVHSWDYLPKVYSFLKAANPSIKIIQDVPMAFTGLLGQQLKDKKKEIYGDANLKTDSYILDCDKYIDSYIAPSQFVKDSLIFEHINPNKINIIPFGVDINRFRSVFTAPPCEGGRGVLAAGGINKHSLKQNEQTINFCFAGAVNKRKGAPYLIEAWKKISPVNARLNLYGRIYPEVRECLNNAEKNNIFTHGFVDVEKEMPKNDVYVFPSILEGSAKSVYEAMACGLPVITTHNTGSIVEDGKSGFIVPIANADALAEKIRFFCEHPEKISEMGREARRKGEEYTWERYAQVVARTYDL